MKTPKFLTKLSAVLTPAPRPKKQLKATARAARPMEEYDEEEPTTKLSSAFIVVLILHVVAVGGIYAFNSIKASRRDRETPAETTAQTPAKPQISDADLLNAPVPPVRPQALVARKPEAAPIPKPAAGGKIYEVQAGDNLTKIAFAYNVSAADIMEANHLKEGVVLQPGHKIIIPAAKAAVKPAALDARKVDAPVKDIAPTKTTPGLYTVKKGDTATSIARTYGLTAEDLLKANKNTDPKKLQPGQTLKVPPRKS